MVSSIISQPQSNVIQTSELLPWQPLFSMLRSGVVESTHYGTLCVFDGEGTPLIAHGDMEATIWTRSLLKPFQLLSLLPLLQQEFPQLNEQHWTMMMASHQGDVTQLELLREIAELTNITPEQLHCPICYPISPKNSDALKASLQTPHALYHPCCGKHMAYVLHQKATGLLQNYTDVQYPAYIALKQTLKELTGKDCQQWTLDGCSLPNAGLCANEIALLYQKLATSEAGSEIASERFLHVLKQWMFQFPELIGGEGRLDTCLMQGTQFALANDQTRMIAKEGADGLLAVGIDRCNEYPNGLGILIKLASGSSIKNLSLVLAETLRLLGLTRQTPNELGQEVLSYQFHFGIQT